MEQFNSTPIEKRPRISRLVDNLFKSKPRIESARALLLTESYRQTEGEPINLRRAKAFHHVLEHLPIVIRDEELIVGSTTVAPRSCQPYPEFSWEWLEAEFDTVATRSADPFEISEEVKRELREAHRYWKGKTTSELAMSYMSEEARTAIDHNIFTPGNYFYGGVGHVTVDYGKILAGGFEGVIEEAAKELAACRVSDPEYCRKSAFLQAVIISAHAAILYAARYAKLARETAASCSDSRRRAELERIAANCERVPAKGARDFYEACQSFWFVQQLLQIESSGHSVSPGRFDQYMYPYYRKSREAGMTREEAQEYMDCVWVKLNDLSKCRDEQSAKGFAGYSMFQNLIAGGQDKEGRDATNDLSFMCINSCMHIMLPQPSFSIRVWNGSPHEFLIRAAELTRTGIGLPAYYNDEVIIPALMNRGLTLEDARQYNVIGCVEPQKAGKTDGWHDAAFFNMCRPLELAFHNGRDADGTQVGPQTGEVESFDTFEKFYEAYKKQMEYAIGLMVNADNAIDYAHMERAPLPFESSMIEDCIRRGKAAQEGGAVYNFTGPQGFGIANMADSLWAVRELVYNRKKLSLAEFKRALDDNYGKGITNKDEAEQVALKVLREVEKSGKHLTREQAEQVVAGVLAGTATPEQKQKYDELLADIEALPKFGNDLDDIDAFAREVAYIYTREVEKFRNPRGGRYQAGLYPVSANVPLGAQTGATPDGRLAHMPVADGVSPSGGKDVHGPTAAANSVSRLDHGIASNGTLFNQKFHPSALSGRKGLENFVALIRSFFDQKGSHMQFNVVSRETLLDAQEHPENYAHLVVRVAGYSALFTTLSRSLQDDIISRTEQQGF